MSAKWWANPTPPPPAEVRSPRFLAAATVAVVLVAAIVLVTAILPAEWGIDPTGAGEVMGLTEMGLFKVEADSQFAAIAERLARQAADSAAAANASTGSGR